MKAIPSFKKLVALKTTPFEKEKSKLVRSQYRQVGKREDKEEGNRNNGLRCQLLSFRKGMSQSLPTTGKNGRREKKPRGSLRCSELKRLHLSKFSSGAGGGGENGKKRASGQSLPKSSGIGTADSRNSAKEGEGEEKGG